MNPTRFEELLLAYEDDALSPEELAEFKRLLASSPAARQRLVEPGVMRNIAASHVMSEVVVELPHRKASRWRQWRPLTAAAAGIVFGMFCTSLVFGYAMTHAVVTASRLFELVDGSFEKASGRLASGFPSEFGKWGGNVAEVIEGNGKDGEKLLRFVKAEPSAALANTPAKSCDVFQLVDLHSLKVDAPDSETMLEMSAQFLDARSVAGEEITFVCWITIFSGSPESVRHEEALAKGSGFIHSRGGQPQQWRGVKAKVQLPPQADFAVVQIMARKASTMDNTDAEFGEQFADDVQLTLNTQPTLPVRLAQR